MSIFNKLLNIPKRKSDTRIRSGEQNFTENSQNLLTIPDDFSTLFEEDYIKNSYQANAWVNIAVSTIVRNIARANFNLEYEGNNIKGGALYELFGQPNRFLSSYDLWKETCAWYLIEGEAFWWFGPEYSGGIPEEIYILNPRKIQAEGATVGTIDLALHTGSLRWFYQTNTEIIPILTDEIIHFKEWNPFNPTRGINPLFSHNFELMQDYFANKANSQLLRNNSIPQGLLKTDQVIRPEEADAIEKRWETKYSVNKGNRKIAVLGKGTTFQPITFSPDVLKLFDVKRWTVMSILAKFGVPARVANYNDKTTPFSGKDTQEQHAQFWKFTLIPLLREFEKTLESQFFVRLGLKERGVFDLSDIPELQKSEDEQSNRDIAEIEAGLKTINDVLLERGKEPKPWGDVWYRPSNLIPMVKGEKS